MPDLDIELRETDVASIGNADRLTEFFHNLGYDTSSRVMMSAEALGLPDAVRHEVSSVERVAEKNDWLQVYLFVLRSVTQANINALARAFRNKAGDYLLVLTKDFEELDFVLLERQVSTAENTNLLTGRANTQAVIRPRTLSVKRRNPGDVTLRVLRRFTYTEQDVFAQFEKLKAAYDVAYWSEPLFNNRALFSDYFLKHRLNAKPGDEFYPIWHTDVKPAFQRLRQLYAGVRTRLGNADEATMRAELTLPVLTEVLGFAAQPGSDSKDEPSYLLYAANEAKPLAACLAYRWGRNLDSADIDPNSTEPEASRGNPTARAVSLMEDGKADWVIVTNGKLWRLYAAQAHSRATNYYEIDLEESLSRQEVDPDAIKYWLLLFRAAAFVPYDVTEKGQTRQMSLLARVMAGSESYAKDLGERLKERIFEDVFPYFAEGFIRNMRAQGRSQLDEAERREVFQGTLTFLYRLLFLLYAESRGLLPVNEQRGYWEISLERIKAEIANRGATSDEANRDKLFRYYSPTDTSIYDRLTELFHAVEAGDHDRNVPIYNGGLFLSNPPADDSSAEADNARFLSAYRIPDRYLALGLDRLARDVDDKTKGLVAIDYKSLGVRQLGSIYEGLLEFTVQVAPEKMAVVRGKKKEELVIPYAEAAKQGLTIIKKDKQERTYDKGDVYLENDKHERKVSGSYYTPDYIVEYIVEHTVGPVLDEKLEVLRGQLRQAQMTYLAEQDKAKRQGLPNADKQAYAKHAALADAVFDIRVLDPAMGSGHFLVEAVDFITDRLLKFLAAYPWNPISHALKQSRETILAEMERQGVSIDLARLTDTNLLKRQVLKRCIYGVDLNPMAVELAKVSLWLDCFTLGAPLSFLDHHMKCGNSLIGAQVEESRKIIEGGQLSMFAGSLFAGAMLATDLMRQVGELPDATAEQVRQSRAEYIQANNQLAPFKRILDIYTSRWFGNTAYKTGKGKTAQMVDPAIYFLRTRENEAWLTNPASASYARLNLGDRKVADTATAASQQYHFFHWELEFPEVFFAPKHEGSQVIERKDSAGFDAVIGNPPYSSKLSLETQTLTNMFRFVAYKCDPFAFFIEQGLKMCKELGRMAFIIPATWTTNVYYTEVRRLLLETQSLERTLLFDGNVFEDANVDTTILVAYKKGVKENVFGLGRAKVGTTEAEFSQRNYESATRHDRLEIVPVFSVNWDGLMSKVDTTGVKLGSIAKSSLGMKLKANDLYVQRDKDSEHNQTIYFGDDVERYGWLQPTRFFNRASAVIVGGTKNHRVYAAKPKILLQAIRNLSLPRRLVSTVDWEGSYFVGTVNGIICYREEYDMRYLQACIASTLVNAYFAHRFVTISMTSSFLDEIPIRRIHFRTPKQDRTNMLIELIEMCQSGELVALVEKVRFLLPQDNTSNFVAFAKGATGEEEHSDVVHDLLAHLADVMLKLNQQRQTEVCRFLDHLEGQLGAKVDALSGKTTIQDYDGDYQKGQPPAMWDDIASVLAKNAATRHRLPQVETGLEAEYERSRVTLAPITAELAATDRLIDQIVYKLYGLTEEEIAVVEGRS